MLLGQVRIAVQLCPVSQAPCPRVDAGDGVCGSLLALLVLPVMSAEAKECFQTTISREE